MTNTFRISQWTGMMLACLGLVAAARAQRPLIKDFRLHESNARVTVNTITQDSSGYLWLGTDEGLCRFNGETFTFLPATAGKNISALYFGREHLWIGGKNGYIGMFSSRQPRSLHRRLPNNKSAVHQITSHGKNNGIWISTSTGLLALQDDSLRHYGAYSGLSDNYVYTACQADTHRLILGTDHGINDLEWKNGKLQITVITTDEGLPDNIVRVLTPVPNSAFYWIGMQQGGIALYDTRKQAVISFQKASPWRYGQVNDILALSDSEAWIATEKGYLLFVRIDAQRRISIQSYWYPEKQFNRLLAGKTGNIWAATDNGLSLITARFLEQIPLNEPYRLDRVTAMTFDGHNTLWLAQGKKLYRLRHGKGADHLELVHQTNAMISCLYSDAGNRLWVGTMGDGLWYRRPHGAWIHCQSPASIRSGNLLNIAGTDQHLWVTALTGVDQFSYPADGERQLQRIRHHDKQSGIGSDYVYFLFPDHKGNIWMATDGAGLCKYTGTSYVHYNRPTTADDVIYSITEAPDGTIWMAAYYKGLYHFQPDAPEERTREEVTDANISLVTVNGTGQLIAVYDQCIDIWYPESGHFRHINYRMGVDSTSSVLNCMARDNSGNVYLPFEDGLLIVKNQPAFDLRASVHITAVSDGAGDSAIYKHRFQAEENYITVTYQGICFTNPERLQYRYRLKGYDREWIPTRDAFVTFPNLPPGNYTFEIQASMDQRFGNAITASYSFFIEAPIWQRPWFIILALITIVSLVFLLIRRKNKKRQQVIRLQQERMTFEYEYLKSQVNPHFLFNSLNTLTGLIEENSEAAVGYTERLSDLYKNMISFRNKDLISLQTEWEILENYLFIQKGRFGSALQVRTTLSDTLMQRKKIIPMALQMLVENAIKHNIVSRTQPLIINIRSNQEELWVINRLNPTFHKEKGAGVTLINIRKRYELLSPRPVTFGRENNNYVVKIPLL